MDPEVPSSEVIEKGLGVLSAVLDRKGCGCFDALRRVWLRLAVRKSIEQVDIASVAVPQAERSVSESEQLAGECICSIDQVDEIGRYAWVDTSWQAMSNPDRKDFVWCDRAIAVV